MTFCHRTMTLGLAMLAATAGWSVAASADEAEQQQSVSVFGEATLEVPAEFKRTEPQSRILEHEFQARAGEGDDAPTARVTMMAAGGDVAANIERWKGQFSGDDKKQKVKQLDRGQWKVHLVDVSGVYSDRVGGGPFFGGRTVERSDHAMLGAILVHPQGRKYFVKMIGPETVVEANRKPFVEMIKSIQ